MTDKQIEWLITHVEGHTVQELISLMDVTYNRLYVACHRRGLTPKGSTWNQKVVNGEKPLPPDKPKVKRIKGEYSNTSPYGIAWDNINAHE